MSFTLQEDLALKALHFPDALIDEARDADDSGEPIVRLETELVLMTGALTSAIERLMEWLGGELEATPAHNYALTMQEDG